MEFWKNWNFGKLFENENFKKLNLEIGILEDYLRKLNVKDRILENYFENGISKN